MSNHIEYRRETKIVSLGDHKVTVTTLTPILPVKERERRRREAETRLFHIFRKYAKASS